MSVSHLKLTGPHIVWIVSHIAVRPQLLFDRIR
jgi:hypothetical protein